MASTARTIISAALRDIRVLGAGDTMTDDDAEDALYQLNNMLDSWWLERLAVYAIRKDSGLTWTGAAQSVTVGSGGTLNIARPFKVTNVIFTFNSIDYPVKRILSMQEYDAIPYKQAQASFPDYVMYDSAYPLASLWGYPIPASALTVAIDSWQQIQSFSTLDTTIALPPGYERAIQKNLALELAPAYGPSAQPSPELKVQAAQAKANLKNVNSPKMVAQTDEALVNRQRPWNIYADR